MGLFFSTKHFSVDRVHCNNDMWYDGLGGRAVGQGLEVLLAADAGTTRRARLPCDQTCWSVIGFLSRFRIKFLLLLYSICTS